MPPRRPRPPAARRAAGRMPLLAALLVSLGACATEPDSEAVPEPGPSAAAWAETKAWVRADFPEVPVCTVGELRAELARDGARPVLLDARAADEFAVSHIEDARWAPDLDAALDALGALPPDTPVVVYCSVGYRSARMTRELAERGYTAVRNLEGSIFEWANAGYPVFRGGDEVHEVHPYDAEWGRLLERGLWSAF